MKSQIRDLGMLTPFSCKEILATIPQAVPRAGIANLHSNLSLSIPPSLFMAGIGNPFQQSSSLKQDRASEAFSTQ